MGVPTLAASQGWQQGDGSGRESSHGRGPNFKRMGWSCAFTFQICSSSTGTMIQKHGEGGMCQNRPTPNAFNYQPVALFAQPFNRLESLTRPYIQRI